MSPQLQTVVALALAASLGACYDPKLQDGGFLCENNGNCPAGFECVVQEGKKVCRQTGRPTPDARPDQARPDAAPDAPPASCPVSDELISTWVASTRGSFDLALTSKGQPHVVRLAAGTLEAQHHWRSSGAWHQSLTGVWGTSLATAMDKNDRLHLLFGKKDSANYPHHLHRDVAGWGNWSRPQQVIVKDLSGKNTWQASSARSLDLAANNGFIFGIVEGNGATTPLLTMFRLLTTLEGVWEYRFDVQWTKGSGWDSVRADVGRRNIVLTWVKDKQRQCKHFDQIFLYGNVFKALDSAAGTSPMEPALDSSDSAHMAYVRQSGGKGNGVYHVKWTRGYSSTYVPGLVFDKEAVEPDSVHVDVDSSDDVHITFIGADTRALYRSHRAVNGTTWSTTTLAKNAGSQTRVQYHQKALHVVYQDTQNALRYSCRVVTP